MIVAAETVAADVASREDTNLSLGQDILINGSGSYRLFFVEIVVFLPVSVDILLRNYSRKNSMRV